MLLTDFETRFLVEQNECTLGWVTKNNKPAATVVSFVWLKGRLWVTATTGSRRVQALSRNPYVSVVISGKGSDIGHSRCLALQGRADIINDKETRAEFFAQFSRAVLKNSRKGADMMAVMMNSSENAVIAITVNKTFPYDAWQMMEHADNL